MTASTMSNMAAVLTRTPARIAPCAEAIDPAAGKTDRIRHLLRQCGPLSSVQIAQRLGLARAALVGALLKADLQRGRVAFLGGRYDWRQDYDAELQGELAQAARLLRRHGFTVTGGDQ